MQLQDVVAANPVIAGIQDDKGLNAALTADVKVVFTLYGSIPNIGDIVAQLKAAKKIVFVDVDLVEGLASRPSAVEFIAKTTDADGILSSKGHLLAVARQKKMLTVHRFFLIDSRTLYTMQRQYDVGHADMIDVMPGIMPQAVSWITHETDVPLISSGLISTKEAIMTDLAAGATGISTTNTTLWQN